MRPVHQRCVVSDFTEWLAADGKDSDHSAVFGRPRRKVVTGGVDKDISRGQPQRKFETGIAQSRSDHLADPVRAVAPGPYSFEELVYNPLTLVAVPVKAPVHQALDPAPDGSEGQGSRQRGERGSQARTATQHHPGEQAGRRIDPDEQQGSTRHRRSFG